MFCLNLWSSRNWVSCDESWKSLLPVFLIFHRTDFGGFLVCCWIAIQQLNGVENNSVAISLMSKPQFEWTISKLMVQIDGVDHLSVNSIARLLGTDLFAVYFNFYLEQ